MTKAQNRVLENLHRGLPPNHGMRGRPSAGQNPVILSLLALERLGLVKRTKILRQRGPRFLDGTPRLIVMRDLWVAT